MPWRRIFTNRNVWALCAMYMVTNFSWYFIMYNLPGQFRSSFSELQKTLGGKMQVSLLAGAPLLIGMSVEANIVTREKQDVLLLPAEAIIGGAVFVVTDGKLARRPVETGLRGTRMVEIVAGVSARDRVVSPATAQLRDGQRVRVGDTLAGAK